MSVESDEIETMAGNRTSHPYRSDDIHKYLEDLKKWMNEDEVFTNNVSEQDRIQEEKRQLSEKLRQFHFPQCPLYRNSRAATKPSESPPINLPLLSDGDDFNTSFGIERPRNDHQRKPETPKYPTATRFTKATDYGDDLNEIQKLCNLQQEKIRDSIANMKKMTDQWLSDAKPTAVPKEPESKSKFLKSSPFNFINSNISPAIHSYDLERTSQQRRPTGCRTNNLESLRERGDLGDDFESVLSSYLAKSRQRKND